MKPVIFLGDSLSRIKGFPDLVRRKVGYELDRVQRGIQPNDWKAVSGLGSGVAEIRIRHGSQWRVLYVASKKEAIYVLHAFQKKTQKMARQDLERARLALREIT